jgi:TRAP-type C4-dicarboxylate transport system substrate-binding protein
MWTQTFLVFTEKAWNKLDENQQDIVKVAASGACELADEWVYFQEKVYIEKMKKDGVTVTYPDTKPFIEASNAIYTNWFKKYPKWKKWYDEIQLFNPETRMPEAFSR